MVKVTSGHNPKDGGFDKKGTEMVDTKVEEVKEPSKEVAIAATSKVPAGKFLADDEMESYGGAGLENVSSKNVVLPRLSILSTLSDQLKPKKVEYIPNALPGDWCDLSVGEIFRGDIDVIPCHFATQYIQWRKGRTGFVANLGMDARCLEETTPNEKRQNILPNGDEIRETATWFLLLRVGFDWRRVFLPLSATRLKVSRKWMTLLTAEKIYGKRGPFTPPLFFRPWTLEIADDGNDQGDWHTFIPRKIKKETDQIEEGGQQFKTIYDLMAEMGDTGEKFLLKECQRFYEDAKNELVVGDLSNSDDPNDGDTALRRGAAIDNTSTSM